MNMAALCLIVIFSVIVLFLGLNNILYSDEAFYASAGLNIAGYDTATNPVLPVFMPLVFYSFFILGLETLAVHFFVPALAIASAILFYKISEKLFNEKTALVALALFVSSGKIISFSGQFLTEMPSVFFILLSFYLFINGRMRLSGFAAFFAATARWVNIAAAAPCFAFLILKKDRKALMNYIAGIGIGGLVLALYFLIAYGNILYPFSGLDEPATCAPDGLFMNNSLYQFYYIFFIPFIFTIPGTLLVLWKAAGMIKERKFELLKKLQYFIPIGIIAATILFYSLFSCKIARYLFIAAPFGLLLLAAVLVSIERKKIFLTMFAVILMFNIFANAYPDDLQTGVSDFFNVNIPEEDVINALAASRQGIPICESQIPENFTRFDGFKNITEKITKWDVGYYTLGLVNNSC